MNFHTFLLLFSLFDIFFHLINIELSKEVLTILDRETLIQLIDSSNLYDSFLDDKVHDVTTKG